MQLNLLILLNYKIMEKITKKQFVELLTNNKSIFLGAINNKPNELHEIISNAVKNFSPDEQDERRTVKKVQTNAIQFTDGSWLYFDGTGEKTYHKVGNVIYQQTQIDYSKDSACSWDDIAYCAVIYYIEL